MGKKTASLNTAKLKFYLDKVPEDRKNMAVDLIIELEFMQETLAELRETVKKEGATALFEQGRQRFMRENPALKAYNTTIQRYSLIYKQLESLLPEVITEPIADPLMDFIKDGQK